MASSSNQREFLINVELFVSTAAGAGLRKPLPAPRKKSDNRISMKTQTTSSEDKKIKEKSSWLALARGPSGTGHWRAATCKLTEEGERCLLNIYVDESILYQTLYIHLLNHTDIRQADISLFFRKNCLGIYCVAGQRWSSNNTADPVYLQFLNSDASNTWLALLRSYAIPEIYGRLFFPADGGSYRMWRQVELSVISGRNLGSTKSIEPPRNDDSANDPDSKDADAEVSCEINLNDTLCGRTTVQKGIIAPSWHENFIFSDLPPFDNLDIIVWREKKLFKPIMLGSVRVALTNFRRGESLDGWFPLVQTGPLASDVRVGELRLKIKVDEEIILPYTAYSGLLSTFSSRNFLGWANDFEGKLKLKNITSQLLSVALSNGKFLDHIRDMAATEVDLITDTALTTLFRSNTILTKVVELTMNLYGKSFLDASIGPVLRRLCAERVTIEEGKTGKDGDRNNELMKYWTQQFWNQIYSVRAECPYEMRKMFETIRKLVEKKFPRQDGKDPGSNSVSCFIFLRFLVPAMVYPHLFGLCPGLLSPPVARSLTLIAKAIQNIGNGTLPKQGGISPVSEYIGECRSAGIDYLLVVSTTSKDGYNTSAGNADRHERLNVVNSLRERAKTKPILDREAVPMLPHLLDIPRHLAIITSAVIRSSRDYLASERAQDPADSELHAFCSRCFQVEELALMRVSQLAARISSNHHRPSASSSLTTGTPRKSRRPSTAPSSSDTDRRRKIMFDPSTTSAFTKNSNSYESVPPSSPGAARNMQAAVAHLKSPSTDYVPASADATDDPAKRKRGLFRGIWRR